MITQPENLSTARLKSELKKRGIQFSPSKPKDYFVKLYRDRVLGGARPTTRQRSEFSSDEETITRRQTANRSKQYSKVVSVDNFMREIKTYSDSELIAELQKHRVDVGPITGTTRGVYEKKLAKLMFEKATKDPITPSSSGITIASESDDEEFSSDSGKEEETDIGKPHPVKHVKIPQSPSSYYLRSRPSAQIPQYVKPPPHNKPIIQEQYQPEPQAPLQTTSYPRPHRVSWCNTWLLVQLVILVVSFLVAFVAFDYVYYGDSRLVDWVVTKYPILLNLTGINN